MYENLIKSSWKDFSNAVNLLASFVYGIIDDMTIAEMLETVAIQQYWLKKCGEDPELKELSGTFEGYGEKLKPIFLANEQALLDLARMVYNCEHPYIQPELLKYTKEFARAFKDTPGADPEWETIAG